MMNIAIIAVAYNRVDSLERLLNSLDQAIYPEGRNVPLIISVDKSNTDKVELFSDAFQWTHGVKIVDKHEVNLGLRPHMLSLGKWFEHYDAIIILEDDIIVSPNFYTYTIQTVNKYYNCPSIAGISLYGYSYNYHTLIPFQPIKDENDVYFMNCAMSWGEVWMRDSWRLFYEWYLQHQDFPVMNHLPSSICRWNKKSWLKYHTRYCIENNKYFVHPFVSLSTCFSEPGEHSQGSDTAYSQVVMQQGIKESYLLPDFGGKAEYYDGFFENKSLYTTLGYSSEELCIDLYGEKKNRLNCRYWLTAEVRNYRILKSFGLGYRPIELNVISNFPGNQLYLYDTQYVEKNPNSPNHNVLLYNYHIHTIESFIYQYGYFNVVKELLGMFFRKITRFHKKTK